MRQICLSMLLCGVAFAQNPQPKLAFEVASIKPGSPGDMRQLIQSGKLFYTVDDSSANLGSYSLHALIVLAFRLPDDQVVQPGWTNDVRFDIHAKLPAGGKKEQVPEMLQTLLAERFGLIVHHDQKVLPVYLMTVAKDGPKFRESTGEDETAAGCNGGFHKVCSQATMAGLAAMLTSFGKMSAPGALDRPVVDATGLAGKYDFVFDSGRVGGRVARSTEPQPTPAADAEVVSYLDAVKVLGLRLEPAKHTFDILVLDHVERVPTEN